jgi:catechol 2,3-dioxygenase-like lactoylglutathione lyase family enzyme
MFSSAVPVHKVRDLSRATLWYRDVLGFEDHQEGSFTRLCRDRVEVLLQEGRPKQSNNPWDTYVRLTGIDTFYDQIRDRAHVRRGPEDTVLGDREVEVHDDNGFVLTFGEWNRKRGDRVAMYDIHPVLAVDDVFETVAWYRQVLGFKGEPRGEDFAMMQRDTIALFFQNADLIQKERGRPFEWDVFFRVDCGQLDSVFDSVKDHTVVLRDPEDTHSGRVFEIEDCNGYVLGFGEE